MQKTHKFGLIITGDGKGGVKAIRANTKEAEAFQKQMQKSGKASKDMGQKVVSSAKAGAAALAALTAASAAYVVHNANQIKQQEMLARALGVSSEGLNSLTYAFRATRVDGEKLADILKDTSEKIGDYFATGGGEAADVIELLNLNINEMVALNPEEQFLKIVEGLDQLDSRSEKIFVLESLANDASLLLPVLEDGAEAMLKAREEAKILGIALDDVDSAQIQMAASDMGRLGQAAKGAGNLLTAQLAPAFGSVASMIVEGIIATDASREATSDLGEVAVNVMSGLVTGWDKVTEALDWASMGLDGLIAVHLDGYAKMQKINPFADEEDIRFSQNLAEAALEKFAESEQKYLKNRAEDLGKNFKEEIKVRMANYAAEAKARKEKLDADLKAERQRRNQQNQSAKDKEEAAKRAEQIAKSYTDEQNRLTEERIALIFEEQEAEEILYKRRLLAMGIEGKQLEELMDQYKALQPLKADKKAAEEAAEAEKKLIEARTKEYEQMVERIDGVFVDVWSDVINGTDNAFDAISNMFKQLLAEMAHQAITKPIMISVMQEIGFTPANTASAVLGNGGSFGSNLTNVFDYGSKALDWLGFGSTQSTTTAAGTNAALTGLTAGIGAGAMSAIGAGAGTAATMTGLGASMASGAASAATGAAATSATAAATGGFMSTVSAALPWIGGVMLVDNLLGGGISKALFGGDWKLKANEVRFNYGREQGLDATNYVYKKKSGGLFSSSKKKRRYRDMPEVEQAFDSVIANMLTALDVNANKLGFDLADNFSTYVATSIKGMNESQAQEAISNLVERIYSRAVNSVTGLKDYTNEFAHEGEKTYETLARLIQQFETLSPTLELINLSVGDLERESIRIVDNLAELSGGLENFSAVSASYYQNFFTDQEKFVDLTEQFTEVLAQQNVILPETRESYRALIEATGVMTEEAQAQSASLIQLSGLANSYYSELESREEELQQTRLGLSQDLQRAYDSILGTVTADASSYMNAQSVLEIAASGGSVTQTDLAKALDILSSNTASNYATYADFERDQKYTAGLINSLSQGAAVDVQALSFNTDAASLPSVNVVQIDNSQAALLKEVQALREQVKQMAEQLNTNTQATATNTSNTYQQFLRIDQFGLKTR